MLDFATKLIIEKHIEEIDKDLNKTIQQDIRAELHKAKAMAIENLIEYKKGC
jgi:hypothetical protein